LVKTDANGQEEWNRSFGTPGWDISNSIIQTTDGGYALAGSSGWPNPNYWLIKTDSAGQHEWNSTFGGSDFDLLGSMIQSSDGGYLLSGVNDSFNATWIVKTDTNGQQM
jgi:hypothetical protein